MTKEKFCEFYPLFQYCIKQIVNGVYVMNASAHLIDYCGGYELELHPECLMWSSEFVMIHALCDKYALSCEVRFYEGSIIIR